MEERCGLVVAAPPFEVALETEAFARSIPTLVTGLERRIDLAFDRVAASVLS